LQGLKPARIGRKNSPLNETSFRRAAQGGFSYEKQKISLGSDGSGSGSGDCSGFCGVLQRALRK
jgi:hypothetical protein